MTACSHGLDHDIRYCVCAHVQDDTLLAYQVCFDLFENESQSFLHKVGCLHMPCLPPHTSGSSGGMPLTRRAAALVPLSRTLAVQQLMRLIDAATKMRMSIERR